MMQGNVDVLKSAVDSAKGRYSEHFLAAIDVGLAVQEGDRPQEAENWRPFFEPPKADETSEQGPPPIPAQEALTLLQAVLQQQEPDLEKARTMLAEILARGACTEEVDREIKKTDGLITRMKGVVGSLFSGPKKPQRQLQGVMQDMSELEEHAHHMQSGGENALLALRGMVLEKAGRIKQDLAHIGDEMERRERLLNFAMNPLTQLRDKHRHPEGLAGEHMPKLVGVLLCETQAPMDGDVIGRQIPLGSKAIAIGRGNDNQIRIHHRSISRDHARITPHKGGWILTNRSQGEETFLNGRRINQQMMQVGDHIQLGKVGFRFQIREKLPPGMHSQEVPEAQEDATILDTSNDLSSLELPGRDELLGQLDKLIGEKTQPSEGAAVLALHFSNLKYVLSKLTPNKGERLVGILMDRVKKSLTDRDLLGRIGPDRLAIVVHVRNEQAARRLAETILANLRLKVQSPIKGKFLTIEVRMGIGMAGDGLEVGTVLEQAIKGLGHA